MRPSGRVAPGQRPADRIEQVAEGDQSYLDEILMNQRDLRMADCYLAPYRSFRNDRPLWPLRLHHPNATTHRDPTTTHRYLKRDILSKKRADPLPGLREQGRSRPVQQHPSGAQPQLGRDPPGTEVQPLRVAVEGVPEPPARLHCRFRSNAECRRRAPTSPTLEHANGSA